ncbi:MAG: proline--tRNA ligase [Methanomassiliicoccaceae archaeon]|nr:proline--tRNA ligase [Methanomassiliicoccaceae archaeon]MCL2145631.1 proline--tRNA ligase [Methanomassiliicoccaceae archaeon]
MEKEDNFGDWYLEIVEKANLSDKRYPIKGMNVWTPYGWKAMSNIDRFIRQELDATHHDEVCFPLMIPETEFKKEKDHIKGFDSEVYWVTHAGLNELDVRLVLRPTSETAMYPMFALWVRSHQDLPLKVYQIVNVFRYETKQTRAFMRVREIHFFESHTCHASEEDAQRQIEEDVEMLSKIAKRLCLPYFLSVRTEWDKFPGAYYTVGIDTVMPNGKTLQIGSIHHYRTNFSEPYEITYEDENSEHKHVHQTTYGMSERLLGALIGAHSDDKGMIMPPDIAPFQTVIIPIFSKDNSTQVLEAARALAEDLSDHGIRVKLDDRDTRPGSKYYDWEIKGVPLRLEIGGRDIEKNVVSFARRDTGEKGQIELKSAGNGVKLLLNMISSTLLEKAKASQMSKLQEIDSLDSIPEGRILRFGWCGCEECGHKFEDTYDMKILGTPYPAEEGYKGSCIICGKDAGQPTLAARTM